MSYTLNLEILHKERPDLGWFTPALDGFTVHPRTKETASVAAGKLVKLAQKNKHFVEKYRIAIYEGYVKYYHKDRIANNLIAVLDEIENN